MIDTPELTNCLAADHVFVPWVQHVPLVFGSGPDSDARLEPVVAPSGISRLVASVVRA